MKRDRMIIMVIISMCIIYMIIVHMMYVCTSILYTGGSL